MNQDERRVLVNIHKQRLGVSRDVSEDADDVSDAGVDNQYPAVSHCRYLPTSAC
ncbi:hypothetical protein J6590_030316 [Homalodisca vitripennis]|nr:hypothetical protein J6590_030316 [Homalodisca vitripennis]